MKRACAFACLASLAVACSAGGTPHPAADRRGADFTPGANIDVGRADTILTSLGSTEDGAWFEHAYAVDTPGDLDGDGYADLLVFTSAFSDPDFAESVDGWTPAYIRLRVGIAYGGPEFFDRGPRVDAAISTVWVWGGETARDVESDPFGQLRVVPAGDVDGDGAVDLLFSVRNGGCQQGNAYLVYGGRRLAGEHDVRTLSATLREDGECTGFGLASALGDLDGDGYDDFAIAAPGRPPPGAAGQIFLYYGSPVREMARRSEVDADAVLTSHAQWVGDAVPLGDIDGDGYDDAAFSVAAASPPSELAFVHPPLGRDNSGRSVHLADFRVLYGGARLERAQALEGATVSLGLAAAGIRGLADMNADGRAEAAVFGVTNITRSVTEAPRVLAGSTERSAPLQAWPIEAGAAEVSWVERAGDVNGDSLPDLLLGVLGGERGDRVVLLLGQEEPFSGGVNLDDGVHFLPRLFGEAGRPEQLAVAAAGGSDLDGDGLDDIALVSSDVPTNDIRFQGNVILFRGRR